MTITTKLITLSSQVSVDNNKYKNQQQTINIGEETSLGWEVYECVLKLINKKGKEQVCIT